jgi:N-acetylglucosaminyldiphosphoundecaprenol N-acetyl-beta-D-mannosaminyltransferase
MKFQPVNILGFNFLKVTKAQFLNQLEQDLQQKQNRFIITANPEIIMYARQHPDYAKIVQSADYLVPDGIGIVKASKFTSTPLTERVTGYDVFTELLKYGNTHQTKLYLLGGKLAVNEKVVAKIRQEYPNLVIVGHHDGYFDDETPIVAEIQQTQPDIVLVATGFPKQETFIAHHRTVTNALWMGIGGSFDVYAGVVKRAPEFWQKHNVEWLYRLITDPKRIKRQIVLPIFMIQAFFHRQK